MLLTSGIIAGESLIGVLLGLLAYLGVASIPGAEWLLSHLGLAASYQDVAIQIFSLLAFAVVAGGIYRFAVRRAPL